MVRVVVLVPSVRVDVSLLVVVVDSVVEGVVVVGGRGVVAVVSLVVSLVVISVILPTVLLDVAAIVVAAIVVATENSTGIFVSQFIIWKLIIEFRVFWKLIKKKSYLCKLLKYTLPRRIPR